MARSRKARASRRSRLNDRVRVAARLSRSEVGFWRAKGRCLCCGRIRLERDVSGEFEPRVHFVAARRLKLAFRMRGAGPLPVQLWDP